MVLGLLLAMPLLAKEIENSCLKDSPQCLFLPDEVPDVDPVNQLRQPNQVSSMLLIEDILPDNNMIGRLAQKLNESNASWEHYADNHSANSILNMIHGHDPIWLQIQNLMVREKDPTEKFRVTGKTK